MLAGCAEVAGGGGVVGSAWGGGFEVVNHTSYVLVDSSIRERCEAFPCTTLCSCEISNICQFNGVCLS